MTDRFFLDTNVLVYLFDAGEPEKQQRARDLLAEHPPSRFVLSTQVLGEFYVTVTRKLKTPLDPGTARTAVQQLSQLSVVATDLPLVHAAVSTAHAAQISYWDSLIIEAAVLSECRQVLTEDLSHGSTIRGVRISNPFA